MDDDIFGYPDEPLQPKIIKDIPQGSEEWKAIRCGKITSSCVHLMMTQGQGATRDRYMRHLAIERIMGKPIEGGFKSKSMIKGNADEPLAREAYKFYTDTDAELVTFVFHSEIENAGASPDALIGMDGGLEIKCPDLQTHLGYLITQKVPANYMWQIQWQMACTVRKWWDFMSYAKELPPELRKLVIRVKRDEPMIKQLETEAIKLNNEIEELIKKLRGLK